MLPLLTWWLALSALGLLGWPLSRAIFGRLGGRGYAQARAVALLGVSYGVWLLGVLGLAANGPGLVGPVAAALAIGGLALWVIHRGRLLAELRANWRHVLTTEVLFASVLALYALYRSYDPAIRHTEQPMDYALLRSVYAGTALPPRDPWFAGQPLNYYYLGYLSTSVSGRLSGIGAPQAYNLGLAQALALAVVGLYGLLHDLLSAGRFGQRSAPVVAAAGALSIALAGNAPAAADVWPRLMRATSVGLHQALEPGSWWWWAPSRVLQDGTLFGTPLEVITEFPAFSFVLGDLHPHVMGLPYLLLGMGVAVALHREAGHRGVRRPPMGPVLFWAPLLLGAAGIANSWDLPTVLVVAAAAYATGRWKAGLHRRTWLRHGALAALWLGGMSVLFYLPFYRQFDPQTDGLAFLAYTRTPLGQYLRHFGLWVGIIAVDAAGRTAAWLRYPATRGGRLVLLAYLWAAYLTVPWLLGTLGAGWAAALLGLVVALGRGVWLLIVLSGLLALHTEHLLHELRSPRRAPLTTMASLFILAGLGLTYVTEFVYVRDLFGTRMNTVFKLYYQAWALLGIGAVLTAIRLWGASRAWRAVPCAWALLLLIACAYGPLAGYSKTEGFRARQGLDATAHLAAQAPAEYGAIRWLQAHAPPQSVMAEAWGEAYVVAHNRASAWSGVPAILGWIGHERQWRGVEDEIRRRQEDLATIYTAWDRSEVLDALGRYGTTFVYVGPRERELYGVDAQRLAWYASFLREVYAGDGVTLYRVPREAVDAEAR